MAARLPSVRSRLTLLGVLGLTAACAEPLTLEPTAPSEATAAAFPTVVSVQFTPSSVGGGGTVTGRVTLSGPAFDGAIVRLASGDPAVVQVPGEVVVSRNTTSTDFPVTTSAVAASTTVTVTATGCCGSSGEATGTLTVTNEAPPATDVVQILSARFKPGGRGGTLTIVATSTSSNAILSAFRGSATTPMGTLTNKGDGRYEGSFSFSGSQPATVTVKSNLGGSATAPVRR